MWKKFISVGLILILSLVLVGCDGDNMDVEINNVLNNIKFTIDESYVKFGELYVVATLKNNSDKTIEHVIVTCKNKENNNTAHFMMFESILPGDKSANMVEFFDKSFDVNNLEPVSIEIGYTTESGEYLTIEDDLVSKTYSYWLD